jgi:anti-sigma factor ChrR (cupin superfamily)
MDVVHLHADTNLEALVHGSTQPWLPSPSPGVERKLLERAGAEIALATSIVRYAPRSQFPPHEHGAGEEFVVLEGVFSDEHGDYPPLTYVRNPPGSVHRPRSTAGCTIFVKLRQMKNAADHVRVVIPLKPDGQIQNVLHRGANVVVELHRLSPGGCLQLDARAGGEELFVFEGSANARGVDLMRWSWWRRPPSAGRCTLTSDSGSVLWIKRGHLDRSEG